MSVDGGLTVTTSSGRPGHPAHVEIAQALWFVRCMMEGYADRYPALYGDNTALLRAGMGVALPSILEPSQAEQAVASVPNPYVHLKTALMLTLTQVCRGDAEDATRGYEALETLVEQGFHPGAAFRAMLAMPDKCEPPDSRAGYAWIVDADYTERASEHRNSGLMGPDAMSYDMWTLLTIEGQGQQWRTVRTTAGKEVVPIHEGRIVSTVDAPLNRYAPLWEVPQQQGVQIQYRSPDTKEWETL